MEDMVNKLKQSEAQLESKIERRGAELERARKRLQGISSVRPEHMDEYEKLESELEKYYQIYIDKFRNLDYLENQLDIYTTKEQEKREESEAALKKIQAKFQQEEYKIINEGNEGSEMNQMGSTRTGFNKGGGKFQVKGNLNDDDDDSGGDDVDQISDDDGDDADGIPVGGSDDEQIDDDDEEVQEDNGDHNF